ncbi:MAG: hypothetical protein J0H69_00005 [Burkholderiales bacterium]|nr:hypothetical protein [Burkholderiales bacterium]
MARSTIAALGLLPVPATAAVLFVVVAAVAPQLGRSLDAVRTVVPLYAVFVIAAPLSGWAVARAWRLRPDLGRAVAFSSATRNSLVVLPLGLAIPGAVPWIPAVIVANPGGAHQRTPVREAAASTRFPAVKVRE